MSNWKTIVRNPNNLGAIRSTLRGGGIAKRGTGVALKGGGRAALRFGSGRTNLLEELGRVEGEHSNPNRRAEISRVHGELNRGYAKGGRAGFWSAGRVLRGSHKIIKEHLAKKEAKKVQAAKDKIQKSEMGYAKGGRAGFEHGKQVEFPKDKQIKKSDLQSSTRKKIGAPKGSRYDRETGKFFIPKPAVRRLDKKAEGGRIGFKKGTDKRWIQKATASIKKRGTKGKCTPITKKGCTGRAKALAKTFKKMAAKRKA